MISIFLADEDWNILLSLNNSNKKQGQSQGKYITSLCMPLCSASKAEVAWGFDLFIPFKSSMQKGFLQEIPVPISFGL